QVKEEGMSAVALDEGCRFATEFIGEVFLGLDRFLTAQDRDQVLAAGLGIDLEVVVSAAEEAEKLVEAALAGMKCRGAAQVPFPPRPRGVPGRFQRVGHGDLVDRQADLGVIRGIDRVELMAEALLVATAEQSGPRRAAIGTRDIAAAAANAVLGQRIDVRR